MNFSPLVVFCSFFFFFIDLFFQQKMALLSHTAERVGKDSLKKWELVGSGGFGHVYKARHKDWGFDVAIKLLREGVG